MRTPAGANQTWPSVGTVSTPQFKPEVRTIDRCSSIGLHDEGRSMKSQVKRALVPTLVPPPKLDGS
jgi:hypothetical protein